MTCRHGEKGKSAGPLCPDCGPARLYAEAVRACTVAGVDAPTDRKCLFPLTMAALLENPAPVLMALRLARDEIATLRAALALARTLIETLSEDAAAANLSEQSHAAADALTAALWPREGA